MFERLRSREKGREKGTSWRRKEKTLKLRVAGRERESGREGEVDLPGRRRKLQQPSSGVIKFLISRILQVHRQSPRRLHGSGHGAFVCAFTRSNVRLAARLSRFA